jgi:dienelactone hydrolase
MRRGPLAGAGLAVLIAAIAAVYRAAAPEPSGSIDSFRPGPGGVHPYLSTWQVAGPFPWASPPVSRVGADDLAAVLRQVVLPDEDQVVSGAADLSAAAARLALKTTSLSGEIKLHALLGRHERQLALAATRVHSPFAGDAALLIESDDAVQVWLNGAEVHRSTRTRRIQPFESYERVPLRKGSNLIVLKLARGARRPGYWDSWSFALGLRSLAGAREEKAHRTLLQEVTTSLVDERGKLEVDLRLHEAGKTIEVQILDHRQRSIRSLRLAAGRKQQVDVSDLPDGLHYTLVPMSAVPRPFPFYKGDSVSAARSLREQDAVARDAIHRINVGALQARLAHLFTPEYRENQDHLWQAKVAHLLAAALAIEEAAAADRPPFRDVTGTHLRGIPSRIDGSSQYYILHVPAGYRRSQGPIPLILIQPYESQIRRPFLQSIPVAEVDVLAALSRISDQQGLAFVWMDNRGNTAGSDFGEADMFQAVEQVSEDYAIDPDRLYLFGSCAGGREALALAAKYPDRFAAVGTMSPSRAYQPNASAPTSAFGQTAFRQKTPLDRLGNLLHVPIYAHHGDENTHVPLSDSLMLRDAAAAAGVVFELDVVPGATHLRFPAEPRDPIFRWLAKHQRVDNPERVVLTASALRYGRAYWVELERFIDSTAEAHLEAAYQDGHLHVSTRNVGAYRLDAARLRARSDRLTVVTNGRTGFSGTLNARTHIRIVVEGPEEPEGGLRKSRSVGGPIWDVFASGPLLVVSGTGGGGERARAAKVEALGFSQSWLERYGGHLSVKDDGEITPAEVAGMNLVIFGDLAQGPLVALSPRLPFRFEGGQLLGQGALRRDTPVAAQYVFPNPVHPERYLLVQVNPAGLAIPFSASHFTLEGWYDYAIWRPGSSGEPILDDVGMFDGAWSVPISAKSRLGLAR